MRTFVATILIGYAALFAFEAEARADSSESSGNKVVVAADAEVAFSAAPHVVSTGVGFGGRLGYRLRIPLISLTPEIGASYHTFNGDPSGTGLVRGFGGARLAFGEIIKPSVFGHIGYGSATGFARYAGPTYDLGVALDFTALPIIDIGIHADYASMTSSDVGVGSVNWIDVGAHVAIYF